MFEKYFYLLNIDMCSLLRKQKKLTETFLFMTSLASLIEIFIMNI